MVADALHPKLLKLWLKPKPAHISQILEHRISRKPVDLSSIYFAHGLGEQAEIL